MASFGPDAPGNQSSLYVCDRRGVKSQLDGSEMAGSGQPLRENCHSPCQQALTATRPISVFPEAHAVDQKQTSLVTDRIEANLSSGYAAKIIDDERRLTLCVDAELCIDPRGLPP